MNTFLQSVRYALQGLRAAVDGRNFRIQLGIALLVLVAAFYFSVSRLEWCVLLFNMALVLSLEIVNSSLENLVDLVTRERHPLAGKVKDLAAGAVVVASGMAIVMGVIVFWPYVEAALG